MIVVQIGDYYARYNTYENTFESDFMEWDDFCLYDLQLHIESWKKPEKSSLECLDYALCKDVFERRYCLYSGEKKDCGRCLNAGPECIKQQEIMNHGNAIHYFSNFLDTVTNLSDEEYYSLLKKSGWKE